MQYIIYFILLSIIGIIIFQNRKKLAKQAAQFNETIEQLKQTGVDKYIQENKAKIENQIRRDLDQLIKNRDEVEIDLKKKIEYLNSVQDNYAKLTQQINEQQAKVAVYESDQRARIDKMIATYEQDRRAAVDSRIIVETEEKQKAAELLHEKRMADLTSQAEAARAQIEQLRQEINDYAAKQAAINEAIMRQRAIDEQQDFYRVCLAPETANDVSVLNIARQNLKKPEIIDKIIYDNYISKPVLEMVKRVLNNESFSGIYKITCTKTGEIYIGKSTDIKSRWQQHAKTTFNCGTIAHSLLHTKMKQHGIENFTFEVVEKVAKDQLATREKFYIDFYQTKETGLNEKRG